MNDFLPTLAPEKRRAEFSPCRSYRYLLEIVWDEALPLMALIALNPSTATEFADDPTLRRVKWFSKKFGHGGVLMLNLFAFRSTDPNVMKAHASPIGQENDLWISKCVARSKTVVAAWGLNGAHLGRDKQVSDTIRGMKAIRKTMSGFPEHPLYLPKSCELVDFN